MSIASFTHSESLANLGPALLAVQQGVEQPTKTSENTFHHSRYADLASCWAACRKLCGEHGIAVIQGPCYAGEQMVLVTELLHTSGEWLHIETPLRPKKTTGEPKPGKSLVEDDPQVFVATVTYLRRCVLGCIFALTPEDDDGNTAAGVAGRAAATSQAAKPKRRSAGPPLKPSAPKPATPPAAPLESAEPPITRASIGNMIMEMVWRDKEAAKGLCQKLTGKSSPVDFTDDELPRVYLNVKAAYAEWEADSNQGA